MKLSGIFVYPIKACAGIALERAELAERGLAFDRRYMLVDRSGTFVTAREVPRICLAMTAFDGDDIVVSAQGREALRLPRELATGTERRAYQVWGDSGHGLLHAAGSRWFSEFLGDEVSLLYMPDSERRRVSPKRARPGDIVSFADGYPLLVISEESLADLNSRLKTPFDMRRFRPNLVVSGCEPYAEDHFASLRIGAVTFRGVKRCARCSVTTVDPDSAERGREPLRTLARYRLEDGQVWFGMNLIHDGPGLLTLGDAAYLQ
ncbi:MAG TPA: MOSC N-terminal beta barrel domain-containing protein [Polyangiaceae bacterium]|nr:MOSC N-terminal beta barrel domain-containing protein [Polyangiaceae bacterium]